MKRLAARLLATMRCDVRLQFRNGFYYAAAFVATLWIILLRQFPALDLSELLPGLVVANMLINTFYFIGGLVLLEKGEGTLQAQVVTPLRTSEYLAAKVLTLALLSLAEALLIVAFTYGLRFNILWFTVGIAAVATLFSLYGFAVVARYEEINTYLIPSMAYTSVLLLPLVDYFKLWQSPLFYLHPAQAPLLLVQAAFQPLAPWQIIYGVSYTTLWIGVFYIASQRAFDRHIVVRAG